MVKELQLSLLGTLEINRDGEPVSGFVSTKAQAVLCYLAVTRQPIERGTLATLLWGDLPESEARANLRTVLANLRKLVGPYLTVERDVVSFNRASAYWLDVELFEALRVASTGESTLLLAAQAVDLYRGNFLQGFSVRSAPDFEAWQLAQQEHFHHQVIELLRLASAQHLAHGEFAPAIDYTRRLLALEPWQEEAHQQLMHLLAHSGQRSAALAQYEVCRRVLAEELGVEPSAETQQLFERLKAAGSPPPHNLPPQAAPLVGRTEELARLAEYLGAAECRLISLVGLGGIGKTRLALHAGLANLTLFQHGVFQVSLAAVHSLTDLLNHLTGAVQLSLSGPSAASEQLAGGLASKEMLLILDSFEQLLPVPGAVELLLTLLQAAPRLKLLITARERLNLQEEWVLELDGLTCPPPEWQPAGSDAAEDSGALPYSALALFLQQAQRVQPAFTLTHSNAGAVVRLCQLLQGIPLGLELAATWLPVLTCAELVTEIERDLDFLTSSQRNVPERHRSMRAVFESSWHLLAEPERQLLQRLSVFRGGFQREAAAQVAEATLPLLLGLLGKSLLRRDETGRYDMPGLIRQFVAEKLAAHPAEQAAVQEKHARYYADFLQEWRQQFTRHPGPRTLPELTTEADNLSQGWQWAVANPHAPAQLIEQYWYWGEAGQPLPHRGQALRPPDPSWDQGLQLHQQGWLAYQQGRYEAARQLLEESLPLLELAADSLYLARSKVGLGLVAYEQGDLAEAEHLLTESLADLKASGEHRYRGQALTGLGRIAHSQGRPLTVEPALAESLAISREIGDTPATCALLQNLAEVRWLTAAEAAALPLFEESLTLARHLADPWSVATALAGLGQLQAGQGQFEAAETTLREAITWAAPVDFRPVVLTCLLALARLWVGRGDSDDRPERALTLAAFVGQQPACSHSLKNQTEHLLATLAPALPPERCAAALQRGHHLTWREGVQLGLD